MIKAYKIAFIGALVIVLFFSIIFFIAPQQAKAIEGPPGGDFSEGIVQCGRQGEFGKTESICGICDLLVLIQRIANFIFYYFVPGVAMIFFLFAGFMIMLGGSDPSKISQGTSLFKTTVIGIVIMFTAWMLTTFVLNILAGKENEGGYFTIECEEPDDWGIAEDPEPPEPLDDDDREADDAIRAQLESQGVGMLRQCQQNESVGCVSFVGMRESTINEILALQNACPSCDIFVTGGTEGGHSGGSGRTHADGYKVDFRLTDSLNNYIETNFEPVPCDGGNDACERQFNAPNGTRYYLEDNHWDVLVP